MSKKSQQNRRREMRQDSRERFVEKLKILPVQELANLVAELGRMVGGQGGLSDEIRVRIAAVKQEMAGRSPSTDAGINISDHAVVRYLERHLKVDVTAIRHEIAALVARSDKVDVPHPRGPFGRRRDPETGLILCVHETSGKVVTLFTGREGEMLEMGCEAADRSPGIMEAAE